MHVGEPLLLLLFFRINKRRKNNERLIFFLETLFFVLYIMIYHVPNVLDMAHVPCLDHMFKRSKYYIITIRKRQSIDILIITCCFYKRKLRLWGWETFQKYLTALFCVCYLFYLIFFFSLQFTSYLNLFTLSLFKKKMWSQCVYFYSKL